MSQTAFGLTIMRSKGEVLLPGQKPADTDYMALCMSNGVPAFTAEFEAGTDLTFGEEWPSVRVAVRGLMNAQET